MIHIHYFITRKAGLDVVAFHDYWRNVHGPIVQQIPQLKAYVQSHRVEIEGVNTSPYDGAAEAWVADQTALQDLLEAPAYVAGALVDEPNFIDMQRVEFQPTEDRVILEGNPKPGAVKGLYRIKRRPEFTVEQFRRYWLEVHADYGLRLPGLRRYVQCLTTDVSYRNGEPAWDGVAQIWFDDVAAVRAMIDSPIGVESYQDILKFVGAFDVLFVDEIPMLTRS